MSEPTNEQPNRTVEPREEVIINALASGSSHEEAAALIGVDAGWVAKRMEERRFRAEVRRRREVQANAAFLRRAAVLPTGGNPPGRPLNIAALRAARPEIDAELTQLENKTLEWINSAGIRNACHGVEIAHEGTWALALTRPGSTITQCSLGRECRGRDLLHLRSNESCRMVLDGGCPACDIPLPRHIRIVCDSAPSGAPASVTTGPGTSFVAGVHATTAADPAADGQTHRRLEPRRRRHDSTTSRSWIFATWTPFDGIWSAGLRPCNPLRRQL